MPTIDLPTDLYARLGKFAEPFIDKEADVVRRLLDAYESTFPDTASRTTAATQVDQPRARRPRERGVRVQIAGRTIAADSVRDLFEQVLRVLAQDAGLERVKALVPFKTSSRRYLIAKQPIHPNGNRFIVPVENGGLFMEAHKSYQTALAQLQHFLSKCGLSLSQLG